MINTRQLVLVSAFSLVAGPLAAQRANCAPDNAGIRLPDGFCASLFADSLPAPRHLRVMPNGDVYVSLAGRRRNDPAAGVILLRDANRDGRAETQLDVARGFQAGEVQVFDNYLYTENRSAIFRFPIRAGEATPTGPADTIVSGLPADFSHTVKTFAISRDGRLYVNVGSASNVCAARSGDQKAPPDPCPELPTRAGIWSFDAKKSGQKQADGIHFVTGLRNAVGVAIAPDGEVWATQHGRDALFQSWPNLFDQKYGAENPAEQLVHLKKGDDFGWPYCYYSLPERKLVDAPEYGGDGKRTTRCASKKPPVAAFPGHWAPNDLAFYTGSAFPAKYRNGAFIAFHGSWNRAPEPQGGYQVVFQPLRDGRADGDFETFADNFNPGNTQRPQGTPTVRPTGLATGQDGALYITDDGTGKIWKVIYTGR
jgi:glucose/arabinose dehydrogenase